MTRFHKEKLNYNKISKEKMQEIYGEAILEKKRALLIEVVENFKYQKKMQTFINKVNKARTCTQLDIIASNLFLVGEGLGLSDLSIG
jgi:hypothetical protein